MPKVRPYALLLGAWLIVALLGSVAGASADGAGSIAPNFLRYGVGGGVIVAALLAAAYLLDVRSFRRRHGNPPRNH